MSQICVIGAGIVGCSTAYELTKAGHEVVLVDAQVGPGLGTSFANGAQLSYSYVEPLASPATLKALPGYLLMPDSPLRFRLRLDPAQWRWIVHFLAACRSSRTENGTRVLLKLAQLSRACLDEWRDKENLQFHYRSNGKLVLCPDAASLRNQVQQVKLQSSMGCVQHILTREDCLVREPALSHYADAFVGGVWTPDECVGDSHALCQELMRCFLRDGGTARFNTQVIGIRKNHSSLSALHTNVGDVVADQYVFTTGVQTPTFARALGLPMPIYPIKGYSLTMPICDASRAPKVSVTDLSRKTVFAPLNGQLRVASKVELVGNDLTVAQHCVDSMLNAVQELFPGACDAPIEAPWAGLRPTTPDSLPLIDRTRLSNAFVNAGHGALGLTLAAGSAQRIRELLSKR